MADGLFLKTYSLLVLLAARNANKEVVHQEETYMSVAAAVNKYHYQYFGIVISTLTLILTLN